MKRLLVALLMMCGLVNAQTVTNPTFYDDSYVHIPLQFGFPFYGRVFTNSWMHSNGVVSFLDPAVPIEGVGYNPGQWAYCCSGIQPSTTSPQFSYMIAPLWTDLYPVGQSSFRTEGTDQYQKYFWNNIAEISNMSNLNSFSLEIRPSGFIGTTYSLINLQNQQTWIGTIGDPRLGEWDQIHYGVGVPSALQNWSMAITNPGDMCSINPLYSTSCPGYTDAMCSSNPLYSTSCPGYAGAYYSQQCSINSLFDPGCPGYASAYLTYQCSISPLYSTACDGYEQAYFNQQCTADSLYSQSCPGYETAYFNQQCELSGLYSNQCPNYNEAYALANLIPSSSTPTVVTSSVTPTVNSDGTVSVEVSATGDSTVDSVIKSDTVSTTSQTAAVQLAPSPPAQPEPVAQKTEEKKEPEQKKENKDNKQETKRQAVAKAKQTAKDADAPQDMAAQQQVQNVVISAMGFTPGFDAYNITLPDGIGYKPFQVYKNQSNVDNNRMLKGLTGASDKLHADLVGSQYR